MKLLKILKLSLVALAANKGRSFLTILGITIGIGSVIALISLGNGVQASISEQIKNLGTTNLTILPGGNLLGRAGPPSQNNQGNRGGGFAPTTSTLTYVDLEKVATINKVTKVSGNLTSSEIFTVSGSEQRFTITGVSTDYFDIQNLEIDKGELFDSQSVAQARKQAVLGKSFADQVFPDENPVGKNLKIGADSYQILGVLKTHDENDFSNFNNQVFVPNKALSSTISTQNLSSFTAQADNENDVDQVKNSIESTLLKSHNITDTKLADFSVITAKDLLSTVTQVTGILTGFLAGIAAISLLVGGIGIMNIMLVSVTERTREIGLRKAVGARTSDILIQFIIESILLTLIGGVIGIGLGVGVANLVGNFINITPVVTAGAVLLAVGVSSGVGLVFGIYPAALASRLNPIDALRYE